MMLTSDSDMKSALAQIAGWRQLRPGSLVARFAWPIASGQAYKDTEALRTNTRTLFTIDALEAMARAVSGYPGRKNLMWLSGSFPIRVEPDRYF